MRDDPILDDYFSSAAKAALDDAERYVKQNRRAKTQEAILTARYFAAKCNPELLGSDFEERLMEVYRKSC